MNADTHQHSTASGQASLTGKRSEEERPPFMRSKEGRLTAWEGCVANFAQEAMKRQLPLFGWGLSGEGIERFSHSEALSSYLTHQLSFLDHVHEFNTN